MKKIIESDIEFLYLNGGDAFIKLAEELYQKRSIETIETFYLTNSKDYIEAFKNNLDFFYNKFEEAEEFLIECLIIPHITMCYHKNLNDQYKILIEEKDYFIKTNGNITNLSQFIRATFKLNDWNTLIKLATERSLEFN